MAHDDIGAERRARLAGARLYLVCPESATGGSASERGLPELVRAAVAGGVDIVQLREKHMSDEELLGLAGEMSAHCRELGTLLIVNDRPLVALQGSADGVHVGQDDMAVADARELLGPEMLIGLSTHAREEIDAPDAAAADYIGVGPVHETPTKPGRPAVGLGLVRYAAANAPVPFFAIGGLHAHNLAAVLDAGARRVVVLRDVAGAPDPQQAARVLRDRLDALPV